MSNGRIALTAVVCAAVFLYVATEKKSAWIPTTAGAVRINAYDYIQGKVSINTAYDQDGVCKNYVNDLNDSNTGIGGAIEDPAQYATLNYYYYKTSSYIEFYKDGQVGFTLTLSTSPVYFKQPRIAPNKDTILNNLPNLSVGQQIQITNGLTDSQGNLKQFTAKELADFIQSVAGPQSFDLTQWVISNLFDQNEQTFMSCVPDVNTLTENTYGPDQANQMKNALENAEGSMKQSIDLASGDWLQTVIDSL
jgi:hypothetical protein